MDSAEFKLGETIVRIAGDHPVVDVVHRELETNKISDTSADIAFTLSADPLPKMPDRVASVGPVFASGEKAWLHWDAMGFRILITLSDDRSQPIDVRVQVLSQGARSRIPEVLLRFRKRTFISPLEQLGYSFINGVLESILLIFGGHTGMIHASSIERSGEAILFPSTGGTGKTTLSLLLVSRHGFNYLADDISFVSPEGIAYFYPRYVMMYPYSLQGLSDIERAFLQRRSAVDKFHWNVGKKFLGPKGVRRRVAPHDLYGNRVADSAPIRRVYFLVRQPVNEFSTTRAERSAIAEISSHILLAEYSYYINYFRYWEATGEAPFEIESLRKKWASTYEKAFSGAKEVSIIRIPMNATPLELEKYFLGVFGDG